VKSTCPGVSIRLRSVGVAIFGLIWQTDGLALDGDAAFALDVHGVQNLVLEIPVGDDLAGFWIRRSDRVDLPWSI
jgi:hypothetical protein